MGKGRRSLKTAFLDSSVLFTAVNSPTGGSSKLFTFKEIKLTVSKTVLAEVEKNVRNKLKSYHLERFFMLVRDIEIVGRNPDDGEIRKTVKIIAKKDAVILAEAKSSQASYLVTLDKKDFLQEKPKKYLKPQRILTPKELIHLVEN